MNVSIVGIGGIGLPMAMRIVEAGYAVAGIEASHGVRTTAERRGISTTGKLTHAPHADVVVVTSASPWSLEKVVDEATPRLAGQRWIVMSMPGPSDVRTQAVRLKAVGMHIVDAPATGSIAHAQAGELQIFAAGEVSDIEAVRHILCSMGDVSIAGERIGDAQSMAIVNQHLCKVHIVAVAEALGLADALGLDMNIVLGLLEKADGGSRMLLDRGPRMLGPTNVKVSSRLDLSQKDCELVAEVAAASGAEVPLLAIARSRYAQAVKAGLAHRDDSRVIEVCR